MRWCDGGASCRRSPRKESTRPKTADAREMIESPSQPEKAAQIRRQSPGSLARGTGQGRPQGRHSSAAFPASAPYTATLLAELPELGQLNRAQVAKLVGVAPFVNQSGKSERNAPSAAAVRKSARALHGGAGRDAVQPRYQRFYQRSSPGKPKKLALVAGTRKLLTILNQMVRTQQPWKTPRA